MRRDEPAPPAIDSLEGGGESLSLCWNARERGQSLVLLALIRRAQGATGSVPGGGEIGPEREAKKRTIMSQKTIASCEISPSTKFFECVGVNFVQ